MRVKVKLGCKEYKGILVKRNGNECVVQVAPKTIVHCNYHDVVRDYSIVWQFLVFLAIIIILRGVYEYQF